MNFLKNLHVHCTTVAFKLLLTNSVDFSVVVTEWSRTAVGTLGFLVTTADARHRVVGLLDEACRLSATFLLNVVSCRVCT